MHTVNEKLIMTRPFSHQSGSSLIEVLIALFVLAIGLLGALAMQLNAIKLSKNASLYSQAEIMLMDIYEAMRASPSNDADLYKIAYGDPTPTKPSCETTGTLCTGEDIVDWNLYNWKTNLANALPGGKGSIEYDAITEQYAIRVRFEVGYDEDTESAITDEVMIQTVL